MIIPSHDKMILISRHDCKNENFACAAFLKYDWKVDIMSLEAIKKITDIEQSYMNKKQEAQTAAHKLVSNAEQDGKNQLERARLQAEAEARVLLDEAEAEAEVRARAMIKESEAQCEKLRSEAEQRLKMVADIIVERIVSG